MPVRPVLAGRRRGPGTGTFVAQLTGEYVRPGGDDRAVPETAARFAPGHGGADELTVEQAWLRQVFAADLPEQLPRLAMVNRFEWDEQEPEIGGRIDWTATSDPASRSAYRSDLPDGALWAAPPRSAGPG